MVLVLSGRHALILDGFFSFSNTVRRHGNSSSPPEGSPPAAPAGSRPSSWTGSAGAYQQASVPQTMQWTMMHCKTGDLPQPLQQPGRFVFRPCPHSQRAWTPCFAEELLLFVLDVRGVFQRVLHVPCCVGVRDPLHRPRRGLPGRLPPNLLDPAAPPVLLVLALLGLRLPPPLSVSAGPVLPPPSIIATTTLAAAGMMYSTITPPPPTATGPACPAPTHRGVMAACLQIGGPLGVILPPPCPCRRQRDGVPPVFRRGSGRWGGRWPASPRRGAPGGLVRHLLHHPVQCAVVVEHRVCLQGLSAASAFPPPGEEQVRRWSAPASSVMSVAFCT